MILPPKTMGTPPSATEAPKRQNPHARPAARERVFERLGRPPKFDRGSRLLAGDAHGGELRVVQPVQHDEVAAGIDNGDRHAPVIARRFGFGRRHHDAGRGDRNRLAVGRGGGRCGLFSHDVLCF